MLIKFLKERAQRKKQKAFREGFGWAMSAYCVEGYTIPQIVNFIERGCMLRAMDSFDRGAIEALRLIEGYPIIKQYADTSRKVDLNTSPEHFLHEQEHWWARFLQFINQPGEP